MKIIFLGAPGTGKGTYSTRISSQLVIPHISTGDIFREAVKQGSELGKKVLGYMSRGELVPDDTTIAVLKERIGKPDCKKGFILDGYPRTIQQADALDKITDVDIVINLNMPDEILIKKIAARRVCKNCGEIYNIADIDETLNGVRYTMPPLLPKNDLKCDKCGGEAVQRKDDGEEVVRERLEVYKRQTKPLIKYYGEKGMLKDVFVTAGPEIMIPKIMKILEEVGN
ncbi:MAG TPA: adenylate kinase [archaeon]|nr:adenylate kinase [archaeon]